ncbi:ParB/RepB/Spo0J family partition protein [Streptomyces sp. NPDC056099]|uniref:ParB/RepB/Spo0J family partition protein n=1 Tax=unclassified Streptomyces TaxID=2593676 RepID=UPI0035DCAA75
MAAKLTGGAPNRRGSGVGGEGTAPEKPKAAQKFYQRVEKEGDALDLDLTDITPNPFNDIRSMGDIDSLAESIAEDGLLQDIVVMHTAEFAQHWPKQAEGIETKFIIAFGERRWRASQKAGKTTITCVLKNAVVPKIRRVLLIENLQRVGYTPMEEARNFLRLNTEEGLSYREIAKELKIGSTHVSRRLQLVQLPAALQQAVEDEDLGVTAARNLVEDLETPEQMEQAWSLVQNEEVKVKDAIKAVISGYLPDGRQLEETTGEDEQVDVPEQRTEADGTTPDAEPEETEGKAPAETGDDDEEQAEKKPAAAKPEPKAPPVQKAKVVPAADRFARERNNASADRTAACLHLVSSEFVPDDKQLSDLFARTMLSPIQQGPAKTKAHVWLREAGKEVLGVSDSDSYFQAVLSSGNDELIRLATFVTALAASEIRAKDNRRQWDRTDAAHVEFLIQAAAYQPETTWEREQLTKFNVAFVAEETADEVAV